MPLKKIFSLFTLGIQVQQLELEQPCQMHEMKIYLRMAEQKERCTQGPQIINLYISVLECLGKLIHKKEINIWPIQGSFIQQLKFITSTRSGTGKWHVVLKEALHVQHWVMGGNGIDINGQKSDDPSLHHCKLYVKIVICVMLEVRPGVNIPCSSRAIYISCTVPRGHFGNLWSCFGCYSNQRRELHGQGQGW